jgi:hypothetical protein
VFDKAADFPSLSFFPRAGVLVFFVMSKAAKKRDCPAVGRAISPVECGANRISHYACPAPCPYLPFSPANYSQLLELEDKLDKQCMDFVLASAPDKAAKERELQKMRFHANPHALHAWFEWNLFFAHGRDGLTCAECLEQSAVAGLNNDNLVLLRAKRQTRVEITLDDLSDLEFGLAQIFITQAALVLVPAGHRAPVIDYAVLESVYERNLAELMKALQLPTPDSTTRFITNSPQLALMNMLFSEFIEFNVNGPKKSRPAPEAQPVIIALIKSVVEVLDAALRN